MSMHDRDYILRLIRSMVEQLGRALGLRVQGPEEARRTLDETGQSLFGPLYRTLHDADVDTIASLVSDTEKRWALAALLHEEGKLLEAEGAGKRATRRHRTAAELMLDIAAREPLTEHGLATLVAVLPRIDKARLSEARRRTLEGLGLDEGG